jgi:pimeloyl-ACP methyl ester carboxylesterase
MKPELKDLSQRVLILHGKEDSLVPYENVTFMEKEFTNVQDIKIISLENEDHFIVWTKKSLIKDSLISWLK